jgi:hypothetical protein
MQQHKQELVLKVGGAFKVQQITRCLCLRNHAVDLPRQPFGGAQTCAFPLEMTWAAHAHAHSVHKTFCDALWRQGPTRVTLLLVPPPLPPPAPAYPARCRYS